MRPFITGSRVLVTGGAGFVGQVVVRRLLTDGYRVRVLDDLSFGQRAALDGLDVELAVADVRSERTVAEAMADVQAVVHLAARRPGDGAREERLAHEVNVGGTLAVLMAARQAGIARVVFASSAAVYGARAAHLLHEDVGPHPTCAEGAQKLCAEEYARLYHARDGLQTCTLRFFSVYGPGQADGTVIARFAAQAAARQPLTIHGDGAQTRDFLYVEDAASAVMLALTTPSVAGRVFNVGSGEPVPVRHVAALLAELVGDLPPARYASARTGDAMAVRASVGAAAATLGFRARVRLPDGLYRTLHDQGCPELRPYRPRGGSTLTPLPTRATPASGMRAVSAPALLRAATGVRSPGPTLTLERDCSLRSPTLPSAGVETARSAALALPSAGAQGSGREREPLRGRSCAPDGATTSGPGSRAAEAPRPEPRPKPAPPPRREEPRDEEPIALFADRPPSWAVPDSSESSGRSGS